MKDKEGRIFILAMESGAQRFDLEGGPYFSSDAAEKALTDKEGIGWRDGKYYIIRVQREVELSTVKARELKRHTFKDFFEKEE